MSNTQFAFIDKEKVPTREQLQSSIDKLGFNLTLDPEFTPFEDEGFSPCTLNGVSGVGFEIYYEDSEEIFEDDDEFKEMIGDKNYCIYMCWGGSFHDCACVLIVSYTLLKDFSAITTYEGDELDTLDGLKSGIDECFKEIKKEEKS